MTNQNIEKGIEFIRENVRKLDVFPGKIFLRINTFFDRLTKDLSFSHIESEFFANLLIVNEILTNDGSFLILTEKGYSFINDVESQLLKLDLIDTLPIDLNHPEKTFYRVWNIIGTDKGKNPYYISSKDFYETIKRFNPDLPFTYNEFTRQRHKDGKSTSTSDCCKDLFCKLSTNDIQPFLQSIANIINSNLTKEIENQDPRIDEIVGNPDKSYQEFTNMNTRKPKLFISHNSEDRDYAKALVQLLTNLGINVDRDVFCSSLPGCGVKFGDNFIEEIRKQYDKYELIILFIHSPRYYDSHISLCEMGAAWIMKNEYRSFLTTDCDFKTLDGVVSSTEIAFKAGKEDTYHLLNDFKEFLEDKFKLKSISLNRWDVVKNDFIAAVSK